MEELLLNFEDLGPAGGRDYDHSAHKRYRDTGVEASYGEIYEIPALRPGAKLRARRVLYYDKDVVQDSWDKQRRIPGLHAIAAKDVEEKPNGRGGLIKSVSAVCTT